MAAHRQPPGAADRLGRPWAQPPDAADHWLGFAGRGFFLAACFVVRRGRRLWIARASARVSEDCPATIWTLSACRSSLPVPSLRIFLQHLRALFRRRTSPSGSVVAGE